MAMMNFSARNSVQKLKLLSRFWGPYLGAGIRVTKVSPDFKFMETRMRLHWYNKNLVGTHYGGSLYSMADPFYMIMLIANIGKDHIVWDKKASIEFVKAVKGEVRAEFKLTDEVIERIVKEARDGEPHFVDFEANVVDNKDELVAKVQKTLYVRRKPTSKL